MCSLLFGLKFFLFLLAPLRTIRSCSYDMKSLWLCHSNSNVDRLLFAGESRIRDIWGSSMSGRVVVAVASQIPNRVPPAHIFLRSGLTDDREAFLDEPYQVLKSKSGIWTPIGLSLRTSEAFFLTSASSPERWQTRNSYERPHTIK